ncbi:MAG TPA: ferredoxin reductase family protein [Cellulomonas sp.]
MSRATTRGRPVSIPPAARSAAFRAARADVAAGARSPRMLTAPARRGWWPDAVGTFTWVTALIVVALWVSGGGIQALLPFGAATMSSLGRLSGLLASDLMLLQVLGMARIPWAERSFGQDRLAKWHRLMGLGSFYLLLAHLVTIVIGYAGSAGQTVLGEAWSMILTFPGMLIATAGTLMIWFVVATSIRVARRKLRYESWHLLHLYAYLGIALALPHQLWTGTDFIGHRWATLYWWTLYAFALFSVLVFRIGRPALLSLRHSLRVAAVVHEGPGIVTLHLTGQHLHHMRVAAGQFFVWRFLSGPGWSRGHPFSLSGAPTTAGLRLTIGTRGDDGERIATLKPGTRVLIEGPYGRMTADVRTRPRVAVFASGLGIAPLMSLLHEHIPTEGPATLVYRMSRADDEVLAADIEWLVQNTGLRHIPLVGPRSRVGTPWLPQELGHVRGPDAVRLLVPDLDDHDVFVCGPGPWSDAVEADLRAAGVPPEALHVENFSW